METKQKSIKINLKSLPANESFKSTRNILAVAPSGDSVTINVKHEYKKNKLKIYIPNSGISSDFLSNRPHFL